MVLHDFSRGPWWPEKTYDAAWSVEFLEHVSINYHYNYVTAFRKAALVFVTASKGHGWHHVEVHKNNWWIRKYESYGLKYDAALTEQARDIAKSTKKDYKSLHGKYLDRFYVRVTLIVFVTSWGIYRRVMVLVSTASAIRPKESQNLTQKFIRWN